MRLLDSNIVIYAAQQEHEWLRGDILSQPFVVSQATRAEVLGWHRITAEDAADLEVFLAAGAHLSITDEIVNRAIELRQQRKMSLGDSLIAATALLHGLELVTRNTDDYNHIAGLRMVNPFDGL